MSRLWGKAAAVAMPGASASLKSMGFGTKIPDYGSDVLILLTIFEWASFILGRDKGKGMRALA